MSQRCQIGTNWQGVTMGWILLLPLGAAIFISGYLVNELIKLGGRTRFMPLFRFIGVAIMVGAAAGCIVAGYVFAIEGSTSQEWKNGELVIERTTYPVAGWIYMIVGGCWGIIGTLGAVTRTREDVLLDEKKELEKERQKRKPAQTREMGFSKLSPKLNQDQFTTFRFARKDKDWEVGEIVSIAYGPNSPSRPVIGRAQIISKKPTMLHDVSEAEAKEDGFKDLQAMIARMHEVHGDQVLSEPMNKLQVKYIGARVTPTEAAKQQRGADPEVPELPSTCTKCGGELMAPGAPCVKCEDVSVMICSGCGRYTPTQRSTCVYCHRALC